MKPEVIVIDDEEEETLLSRLPVSEEEKKKIAVIELEEETEEEFFQEAEGLSAEEQERIDTAINGEGPVNDTEPRRFQAKFIIYGNEAMMSKFMRRALDVLKDCEEEYGFLMPDPKRRREDY
jgi:hypothetical protein